MDPHFPNFVIAELKTLLSEIEDAKQPSNSALHEAVIECLRKRWAKLASEPGARR